MIKDKDYPIGKVIETQYGDVIISKIPQEDPHQCIHCVFSSESRESCFTRKCLCTERKDKRDIIFKLL